MFQTCHVKPVLMLPVPFVRGIEQRKIFKDDTNRVNFLDRLDKVLSETVKNISAWKATDKTQSKKPFPLLGGQGIGVNNGGACPKLNISHPAVSISTQRGERIASDNGYSLMDE